jgi:hypothetical protein
MNHKRGRPKIEIGDTVATELEVPTILREQEPPQESWTESGVTHVDIPTAAWLRPRTIHAT